MEIQCQQTRIYLRDPQRHAGGVWICPFCGRDETYQLADHIDHELCGLVNAAIIRAREIFGKSDDGVPTRIWLGDGPEAVFEAPQGVWHIYLKRDGTWPQLIFQAGQEAFHRCCSNNQSVGWEDEMLSLLFALRFLREVGMGSIADLNEVGLRSEAEKCPQDVALALEDRPFPDGFYGRCFVIGEALEKALGWEHLARLPSFYGGNGRADLDAWLESLPTAERDSAMRLLAGAEKPA